MKVLYVSSNGGIHDYRFLKKLSGDFEVLFLHYASGEIITEIDKLPNLEIISKKPAFKSFPLASELWHFKKIIKEFQPDIIHSGYVWQVGILPAMAGFHPHLSMPWGSDILIEPDNSFIIKHLVKKVMKQCGHIQCDAEFVKKKIINDYGIQMNKITVFPWGIDLNLFKKADKAASRVNLNIDGNTFVIVFNRHFEPVYGIKDLMEGFNIFSKGKNDVLMLMLSEGSQKNDALKFITENKLEDKINLIGRVANTELPSVLNASDVYVSTSLSDGSSLSLLEAMACGLGIVVTDVPAIKEWVSGENGMVVPRKSPYDIAKALESYYQNRQLLGSHGIKNIEIAALRCDWDQNYLKLKEIYSRLVNG